MTAADGQIESNERHRVKVEARLRRCWGGSYDKMIKHVRQLMRSLLVDSTWLETISDTEGA